VAGETLVIAVNAVAVAAYAVAKAAAVNEQSKPLKPVLQLQTSPPAALYPQFPFPPQFLSGPQID